MPQEVDYEHVITVPAHGIGAQRADSPNTDERIDTVLIPEICLQRRISALAAQICRDYADTKELYVVVVLKGAFVFAADLGRAIHRSSGPALRYDFVKAVTYGKGIKASGESERQVRITLKPEDLQGQHILLLDDIVDQAFTLTKVQDILRIENTASIRICALLHKALDNPAQAVRSMKDALPLDYVGFTVPDRWVAGYGIDAGGDFRHLPYIVAVNEAYYEKGGSPR